MEESVLMTMKQCINGMKMRNVLGCVMYTTAFEIKYQEQEMFGWCTLAQIKTDS